jgi:hypothetical protein
MNQIKTLKDLGNAVKLNKVLYCPFVKHPNRSKVSSCFLMKQSGNVLLRLFEKGLYIYEPKTFTKKPNRKV